MLVRFKGAHSGLYLIYGVCNHNMLDDVFK